MRCGKCGQYTPGYNCSHCSRAKSRGKPKPLDVALKKLEQQLSQEKDNATEPRKERHQPQSSLPENSQAVPGGESKDPVESD